MKLRHTKLYLAILKNKLGAALVYQALFCWKILLVNFSLKQKSY